MTVRSVARIMSIVDFHTHILPGIDDGSQDVNMSLGMVEMAKEQQVDVIVATPHFYATRSKIEDFVKKRDEAYHALQSKMPEGAPVIKLGAEVAFFEGIGRAEKLDMLKVKGTNVIMIEMPYTVWKDSYLEELKQIQDKIGLDIILAHLERYLDIKGNEKYIKHLLDSPYIIQINTGSLNNWKKRRKILRIIRDNKRCILGSDCHGMVNRAPNQAEGREVLKEKLGESRLLEIDGFSYGLLKKE